MQLENIGVIQLYVSEPDTESQEEEEELLVKSQIVVSASEWQVSLSPAPTGPSGFLRRCTFFWRL